MNKKGILTRLSLLKYHLCFNIIFTPCYQNAYDEELFNIINDVNLSIKHDGKNCMEYEINKNKNKNITQEIIMCYYLVIMRPVKITRSVAKKGLVVKPIISSKINSWYQIDLINIKVKSEGVYKFICVILRTLAHKSSKTVANFIFDVFTLFGELAITQSENEREFVNKIMTETCYLRKD